MKKLLPILYSIIGICGYALSGFFLGSLIFLYRYRGDTSYEIVLQYILYTIIFFIISIFCFPNRRNKYMYISIIITLGIILGFIYPIFSFSI